MTVAIRYAVRSDKGLVRGNNEDSVYAGPRLIAIADGMGGHAGGEVASRIVIGAMEELDDDRLIEDLITALRAAVADANDSLSESVSRNSNLHGMGTTLTAMRFSGSKIGLVHVGDSRGYLLRDGELAQITHDDTYVQSLVDSGRLTAEEAMHHPRKSVILRALNGSEIEPDVSIREAIIGDRYLLCSDGLTDVVRPETLLEALGEGDPQDCADRLVQLALRGGGPDNVTVVVADVVRPDEGDEMPVAAGAVVDGGDGFSHEEDNDDSPAGRAAGLDPTKKAPTAVAKKRDRRWPRIVVPLLIILVLAAAAIGTWMWTQSQYFVGRSHGVVTVFKGVNTAIGPVHFYSAVDRTDVRVDDLIPAAKASVIDGITASSRAEAERIVERLTGQQLPVCAPTPSASRSSSPSTDPSTPATASSGDTAGPLPGPQPAPTPTPSPTDTGTGPVASSSGSSGASGSSGPTTGGPTPCRSDR